MNQNLFTLRQIARTKTLRVHVNQIAHFFHDPVSVGRHWSGILDLRVQVILQNSKICRECKGPKESTLTTSNTSAQRFVQAALVLH